ncbi:histidine-specific methyltransferase [Fusarium redolens]|uniref:4-dimethylallyltryptophan N-methyltransferase n=1 Tax=Fusarium redolens TaxID=48865 RepID=A0A9P9HXR8_FUSRE|nr:histidine-specific methyltransferase [Fusarium redolens]KAH7265133.1 histidine-specific methyltransferase [Fusarium redolens]
MDPKNDAPAHGAVVDIGGSNMYDGVGKRLQEALTAPYSPTSKPTLPDELLYDDVGLPIWNQIIFTPEFYQTHDEIALFDKHGADVAARCPAGVTIIDLGAGLVHPLLPRTLPTLNEWWLDTRKVGHLLAAFEKGKVPAKYLALDISRSSLNHNVKYLVEQRPSPESSVTCAGIWGTFGDGMSYIQKISTPRLFLSLGSVLCNDPWPEALAHLKFWADALRPDDLLLIGMDGHTLPGNKEKIWNAYHSCDDLYHKFFLNGFKHANRLAGEEWFREEDWELLAQLEDEPTTRHRFFFRAKNDVKLKKMSRTIQKGEEFDWFDSHKYGEDNVRLMCYKAGLSVIDVWQAPGSEFRQYLVRRKDSKDQRDDADSAVSGVSY